MMKTTSHLRELAYRVDPVVWVREIVGIPRLLHSQRGRSASPLHGFNMGDAALCELACGGSR